VGIAQLAHAVGESIFCRVATWLIPNDVGEDLLSKVKDFSRSQAVTYNDNISETVLDQCLNCSKITRGVRGGSRIGCWGQRRAEGADVGEVWEGVSPFQPTRRSGGAS